MTALKEFDRLESPGIWRATPDAQRRDVIVSIGDATLTISDHKETALTHWSLPAVERSNPGELPAVFRPGPDATETLELEDETMIQAVAKVQSAIERRRPHPGRLRYVLSGGAVVVVMALLLFWLPNAMTRYAAAVVPPASRLVIGHNLLDNIRRISGSHCSTANGDKALAKLHRNLFKNDAGRIAVVSGGVREAEHLPGGIIVLNRALVEDYEAPDVAAGFVIAESLRAEQTDPLVRLLQTSGLRSAFRLLTTGKLRPETLASYGEFLLTAEKKELDEQALLSHFRQAGVSAAPYAYALDMSGETTLGLIEADPVGPENASQLLSDGDWVGLQQICGE